VFALHVILILCTVAIVAAAFAVYRLVRSHMRTSHDDPSTPTELERKSR
jgi:hypothetical protein